MHVVFSPQHLAYTTLLVGMLRVDYSHWRNVNSQRGRLFLFESYLQCYQIQNLSVGRDPMGPLVQWKSKCRSQTDARPVSYWTITIEYRNGKCSETFVVFSIAMKVKHMILYYTRIWDHSWSGIFKCPSSKTIEKYSCNLIFHPQQKSLL